MPLVDLLEIAVLTFALAAWFYARLPKPEHLWQIAIAGALALVWPSDGPWITLVGLVIMWLAALWLIGWAARLMGRYS